MRIDWPLWIFRWGALVCLILLFVASTQFAVVDSAVAVLNGNPTAQQARIDNAALEQQQKNCLTTMALKAQMEYAPHCHDIPPVSGMPGDVAARNLAEFAVSAVLLAVLAAIVAVSGARIWNRPRHEEDARAERP